MEKEEQHLFLNCPNMRDNLGRERRSTSVCNAKFTRFFEHASIHC